jgi:2-oxoglutarate ferredoxin oxidoreductase subunit beta
MIDRHHMTWCPGCGNFAILKTAHEVLSELLPDPRSYVVVGGIGQAAKLPHYLSRCNAFSGLHGRATANAVGIRLANPKLRVILFSGDGDLLAEGGNHFLHAIRRNIGIACFLHDNQVYGLTRGQASPTAWSGMSTTVHTLGVAARPYDPLVMALAAGVRFAARTTVADLGHLRETLAETLRFGSGFALCQILQTCPSFNKERSVAWYKEHTTALDPGHDLADPDRALAAARSLPGGKIPLGVFYRSEATAYEQSHPALGPQTLVERGLAHRFTGQDLEELLSPEVSAP